MKDVLNQELEPGDLVVEIDTAYQHYKSIGIVLGGMTNSGRVRFIKPRIGKDTPSKHHSRSYALIKIDEVQAALILEVDHISRCNTNMSLEHLLETQKEIKG